ncbi:hypothetical protein [Natrarchaeobaculum aegyptiacum]|uniref:Uncharacterized protein n=1 Tax=Natrarchaeobaculum aegyptiacum TaxID=745377 RepID=A0A2Z2HYI6_9EURY|nr:hypothetical protein [Natrarchaeobaculum aegyptiacum]ARS90154.1 hypothetical protein B1756_10710 [Natrarchaeobaculum aegyptiacum]
MADSSSRMSRRSVIAAAAAVGLAGCTSGESDDAAPPEEAAGTDDASDTATSREDDIPDRDIEPDWEQAATFRTWLRFDSPVAGGTRRFDYTEAFPDDVDLATVLPAFSDLTIDDVDGHLIQGYTQVLLGGYDVEAIAAAAETADEATYEGTYEGYAVITEEMPGGSQRTLAIDSSAIVIGDDYEVRIDARNGEADRLEDVDPEFTHLFHELPHETTVTGQYDAPQGSVVNEDIYLWGVSSETPMAEEMTWVFVFDSADSLTEEALEDLEAVSSDVHSAERDGRTATVVGAPPEVPEEAAPGE